MYRKLLLPLPVVLLCCLTSASMARPKEIVDPAEAAADPDFAIQGEYVGEGVLTDGSRDKVGAQVIALGGGSFRVVVTKGGLPGAGWQRGQERFFMDGKREGEVTNLTGEKLGGTIADGKITITDADGKEKIRLTRTERKSPTLGAKPPQGAVVIFDGSNTDLLDHGRITEDKNLMAGVTTKPALDSYKLHMEFRLSWMPGARGQGRSNSGVYFHDCYECQVLDSFGLEGRNNECGGFYKVKEPDVNMCLPPLTWQTYDVEFTAPQYDGDKRVKNARITIRHNGVLIHDDVKMPGHTPGRKGEGPGPRGIHLQGHGCKVQYRNIWMEKK